MTTYFSKAACDTNVRHAIGELFMALTDLYINIVDHYIEYYEHIDGFYVHDDWGAQLQPFFSVQTAKELIVPAMKKFTDHLHSRGFIR